MHVVLIPNYLFGLAGLVAGGAVGLLVAAVANNGRLPARDARVTAPLLLAAAVAHLVLIPFVELERQVLSSQRRRRIVANALARGAHMPWDFQPHTDASVQWVRGDDPERERPWRLRPRGGLPEE